jgi:acyl carrier protein
MLTADKVKEMLSSINGQVDANDLTNDLNLTDQGIESLDTFDFFLQVEEDFGVTVTDDKMEELNTINKIVEHVNEQS